MQFKGVITYSLFQFLEGFVVILLVVDWPEEFYNVEVFDCLLRGEVG